MRETFDALVDIAVDAGYSVSVWINPNGTRELQVRDKTAKKLGHPVCVGPPITIQKCGPFSWSNNE